MVCNTCESGTIVVRECFLDPATFLIKFIKDFINQLIPNIIVSRETPSFTTSNRIKWFIEPLHLLFITLLRNVIVQEEIHGSDDGRVAVYYKDIFSYIMTKTFDNGMGI